MSSAFAPELEPAPCPLGCPRDDEKVLTGRDRIHGLPGEFTVVRCRGCGTLRTDPRPTPASIGSYYPDDYGPYVSTRVEPAEDPRPAWRRALSRLLARLLETNAQKLPPITAGRMLEIGCASGAFLHRMAARGWQVEGIEFSETAAAAARSLGYRVDTGQVETIPDKGERYDLVVGWMVLEHLHDPILALRRLKTWTKPGGWLVISVPNAESYEMAVFGEAWYALHLPNHLHHFTPRTLEKVLDRSGWRLSKILYHRDLRNVAGSLGYVVSDKGLFPRLAGRLAEYPLKGGRLAQVLHPLATVLAALGQTGLMTAWARRDDR